MIVVIIYIVSDRMGRSSIVQWAILYKNKTGKHVVDVQQYMIFPRQILHCARKAVTMPDLAQVHDILLHKEVQLHFLCCNPQTNSNLIEETKIKQAEVSYRDC